MLEQMARALCEENSKGSPHLTESMWETGRDLYMRLVAVSLRAIRDPTDGLIADACASHEPCQPMSARMPTECPAFERARQRWRDQINAILEERA